ncbi:MAG: 4Fe-4S dicluster domain-containing protein, partial [Candidatus Thorarchaeota archaeon]
MNQKALFFEPKKCIGCRLCEQICTMTHFGITNSKKALIQIIRYHNEQIDRAIFCHSCKDAPCIEACSFDVLSKNPNTNAIEVNKE